MCFPDRLEEINWEVEEIPEDAKLFYRIPLAHVDTDSKAPLPHAFRVNQDSMSTDWNKYCTPSETLNRFEDGKKRFVVSLEVNKIKKIPFQRIQHSPILKTDESLGNRAHTDVFWDIGEDNNLKVEIRFKYMQIYVWEISP